MQAAERIGEVLEMIVCPACHGQLDVREHDVWCTQCGKSYPIEDGIPVLLIERAKVEP